MAKAENLSGQIFGYLKVIERIDDHISRSGLKKYAGCVNVCCVVKKKLILKI